MSPDKSLAEILAQRMGAGEPIPVPLTLAILRQVCDALDYAHTLSDPTGRPLGIVHRDVSPAHIFVGEGGRVTLVASTTQHGTFAYMAPEWISAGVLDLRADLFALGVVAHEMLTNRPLFATGDDRETLDRVCALAIAPPSAVNPYVPAEVDGIVLMALAREPAYRWQSAAMMRDGLAAVTQRLGLVNAAMQPEAWADLLAGRIEAAPQMPPSDPDLWADDTNQETRIQPLDPALAAAAQVAPAPVAAAPVARAPLAPAVVAAPVSPIRPAVGTPAPIPIEPPPAAPPPAAPPPAAPPPAAPPLAAPPPAAPPVPSSAFDPELGPEPTQIGAIPLISFGDTPMVASIGEKAPRVSATTLPPAVGTFLLDSEEEVAAARRRRIAILAGIALLVVVAIVVIVLVAR